MMNPHFDFTPEPEPEGPGCAAVGVTIIVFMLGVFGAVGCFIFGGNVLAWVGSAVLMCVGIVAFVRITR